MDIRILGIYGNGIISKENLVKAKKYDYLIATDVAALKLLEIGISPHLAIGDFDSVTPEEFAHLKEKIHNIEIFPPEKDFTDLELSVKKAIGLNPQKIEIYGATGTRLDHVLAAIHLLDVIGFDKIQAKIIDSNNEITIIEERAKLSKEAKFTYFSIIPYTQQALVSIAGSRFNLNKRKIKKGETIGLSNEVKAKVCQITVHSGKLILIKSRD